jgi:MscS family membrane protein
MYNNVLLAAVYLGLLIGTKAEGQLAKPDQSPVSSKPESPTDALGRSTPRGTVFGFLRAARKGDDETAAQYLNTELRGQRAAVLAHKLFVVLDRRLPARLNELSDRPEGSMAFLTRPNLDLVGTISNGGDKVDIVLEHVDEKKNGQMWLFSKETLDKVPDIFDEVNAVSVEHILPAFLVHTRIAQIALFEWLGVLLGLPLLYLLTGLLGRGLRPLAGSLRRRVLKDPNLLNVDVLPKPVRLLLIALTIRWTLSAITLSLLARQFWSGIAATITIVSSVWLFILFNGRCEDFVRQRFERSNRSGATAVLGLGRRTIDVLAIFVGILVALHYFGVKLTAALAGLGVGGIAVALAAQKTLENVIGGISIIFDQALRVGDTLNIGSATGVVESVGLRSTRIRTLDRTVISVPNGQLANVQLENLSVRDKFWFHPNIGLRYETTEQMLHSILDGASELLTQHQFVESGSVRVRFLRFGSSSFDIEVFAYVLARDWPHFLEIQEELLLRIMAIVDATGAHLALPSQIMYLATDHLAETNSVPKVLPPPAKETVSALQ